MSWPRAKPAVAYRLASFRNAILWRPTRRPRTEAKSPVKATPDYGMTDPKRVYDVIGERELSTLYGRPQSFAGCPEAAVRLQGRDPGHTLGPNHKGSAAVNNRTSNAIRLVSTRATVAHVRLPHAQLRLRPDA